MALTDNYTVTLGGTLGGSDMNCLNSTSVKVKVVKIYTTYVCMTVKLYLVSLIGPATRASSSSEELREPAFRKVEGMMVVVNGMVERLC